MFNKWIELDEDCFIFITDNALYHASYTVDQPYDVRYEDEVNMRISVAEYVFEDGSWQWGSQVISKSFELYEPQWGDKGRKASIHHPRWYENGCSFWNTIVDNDPSFFLAFVERSRQNEMA